MQIKHIDSLGIDTSRLGFGAMRLPTKDGEIDLETTKRMVDNAMAKGLTYFDTAYVYHSQKSEGALKDALVDRYPRTSFTVADKIPLWKVTTEADLPVIFEEECTRLGVDYIDFLLLHAMDAKRWEFAKSVKANEYQLQLKKEGKIRFAGFSFHDKPAALRKMLEEGTWDFVQLQINYFDWDDYARECYDITVEFGIPVIVMEPIRGGALAMISDDVTGPFRAANPAWTNAAWALRFVADHDNIAVILSGMSNEEQIAQNLETFDSIRPLTDAEKKAVEDVCAAVKAKALVPCTGCRYCMDCPFGVDIPEIYSLYNDFRMFNDPRSKKRYAKLVDEGHGAPACMQCGACMEHCPQNINTPELLPTIHEELTK